MKKPVLVNNYIYHVYNRGVEKRQIFMDDYDYKRFIHNLYEFNDTAPAGKFSEMRSPIGYNDIKRQPVVEILCFCLMPNHFHLMLRQLKDGGILSFMRKLGIGYAMYFNQKYDRVGSLFQNRFKAVLIETDEYLTHLSRYIHLNPVELIESEWKIKGITNWNKVNKLLSKFRWSSHLDYIGRRNYPSVISTSLLLSLFTNNKKYQKFINKFLFDSHHKIKNVTFE